MVQKRARSIKEGRVNREARIEPPKSTNYIVPANEVNRPKSEIKLQQREIKTRGKPSQQEKPGQPARPERVSPAKPGQPEQPAARPERAAPAKPAEKGVDKSKKVEKPDSTTKEGNPQEKVGSGKPKEMTEPLERGAVEKQKDAKSPGRNLENPKGQTTLEKQIERPRGPKPSEKDLEERRERKPRQEEGERPK